MKELLVDGQNMKFTDDGVQKNSVIDQTTQKSTDSGKKDLKKTWIRWLMLVLSCFFLLGSYYCFDNPSVLESQMES